MNTLLGKFTSFFGRIPKWIFAATIVASTTATFLGIVYNYINSKVLVIQVGCLMVIIMGLFLVRFKQVWEYIKASRIIQLALALVIISGIASVTGLDPTLSLFSHFERGTGWIFQVLVVLASFSLLLLAQSKEELRKYVLYPMVISGGVLAFFTWIGVSGLKLSSWVILGSSSDGGGTMGNSSFAGTMFVLTIFVALYLVVTETSAAYKKMLYGILFITVVNPVLFSLPIFKPLAGTVVGFIGDARGAAVSLMVGLIVMGLVFGLFSQKKIIAKAARVMLVVGVVSVVLGIVLLVIPGTPVHEYFVSKTGSARFIYWSMSLKQVAQYPVLGTGPETFRYAHERFFDPALSVMGEPWADKVHNVYVEQLLTTGVVGFATYLALLVMVGVSLYRYGKKTNDRYFVATMAGLLVAYGLNNIILFDTMTSLFWFYALVMVIAGYTEISTAELMGKTYNYSSTRSLLIDRAVAGVLVVVITISGITFVRGEITKLSSVWDELFSKPPERMAYYMTGEQASPYGAAISFAQRADDYAQGYLKQMSTQKKVSVHAPADIIAINQTLLTGMLTYRPNMQSYMAMGNLAIAYMRVTGSMDTIWLSQLKAARDGLADLSPNHPKLVYLNAQVEYYESQLKGKK